MMKRIVALTLTMLLLCAATAQAAQWRDGLSPSQPYSGVPEVDLSEQMGYMMLYPNEMAPAAHGCQKLFIYLPREDVKAGDGVFYLYTEKGTEVFRASMNDTAVVMQRAATEAELEGLLWGSGTCFEIVLPRTLDLGGAYFANMERGGIVTQDGIDSPEIGGKDAWAFAVEGDYGVSAMEYADGEVSFELMLGGEAAQALLYGDDSVFFAQTLQNENGTVTGRVNSDTPHWGVLFLDEQGNELNRIEFR